MNSIIKNECFINGVEYKCRTCFDPGQIFYPLTDEVGKAKTCRDVLKDLVQFQLNEEDLLPNMVCCICLEKLQNIYDFIIQIENVNNKYSKLLETVNDPLHETVLNDIDNLNNYLAIDMPLEEDGPKIKLEEDLVDPNSIILDNKIKLTENCATKFENEESDEDDPFSKNYDPDFNCSSDQKDEEEIAKPTTSKSKPRPKRRRKAVTLEEDKDDQEDKKPRPTRRRNRTTTKPKEHNTLTKTENTKSSNAGDEDNIEIKSNVCPYCSKNFKYRTYVLEHIRCVHEKLKPFKCSKCDKVFSSKHTLQVHEMSHTDIFPFQCEYCDRRFRLISKLRIHTEIHTTKPELLCPICHRGQKSKEALEEHIKNHDYKRLQCISCGKLFSRNSNLTDHYNAVHLKLRPYKCQYCELGFGDRKTRRMHERKHHPKEHGIHISQNCNKDIKKCDQMMVDCEGNI